ncbi:MAG: transposase [Planctomycetaceae bacterium]|nr:transposase [Planctomycetaceae bacterium]
MVIAHHLMWTAYGFWLPNDPRGSMSREVAAEKIADLGPLHYGRKARQPSSSELSEFRLQAQSALKYELLSFAADDIQLLACGFADVIKQKAYTCYACAIMPDHVHLLIRKHRDKGEAIIERFQLATRELLIDAGRRPTDHPVWGGPGWNVFQSTPQQVENTIRYILNNPVRIGRPMQHWPFVTLYDGWLPGIR